MNLLHYAYFEEYKNYKQVKQIRESLSHAVYVTHPHKARQIRKRISSRYLTLKVNVNGALVFRAHR